MVSCPRVLYFVHALFALYINYAMFVCRSALSQSLSCLLSIPLPRIIPLHFFLPLHISLSLRHSSFSESDLTPVLYKAIAEARGRHSRIGDFKLPENSFLDYRRRNGTGPQTRKTRSLVAIVDQLLALLYRPER